MQGTITRREAVAGTLGLLGTGSLALALGSDTVSATADIQTAGFDVPNKDYTLVDGAIDDVRLAADVSYGWDANVDVTAYDLSLSVGFTNDSAEVITSHERDGMAMDSYDDAKVLESSILNAPDFDASMFTPAGDKTSVDVTAIVELILFRDGEVLATDTVYDAFVVTVTNEEIQLSGTLEATGNVSVSSS